MADPTPYGRDYSFSGFQANNPQKPLPGPKVDEELDNLGLSVNQTIAGLKDIRRADGALRNGIVTAEAMAPGIITGLNPATEWQAGKQYFVNDTVFYQVAFYRCLESHVSNADFTVDLAASRWEKYADLAPIVTDAEIARDEAVAARDTAVAAAGTATSAASAASADASTASGAATSAAASATSAAASYDLFDDRYLGEKTSLPTLDNDGNALLNGALVSLTGQVDPQNDGMYVRRSGAWQKMFASTNVLLNYARFSTSDGNLTAGQTTFVISGGYIAGYADVYRNGLKLVNGVDVTITSGTQIVLASGVSGTDTLEFEGYRVLDSGLFADKATAEAGTSALTILSPLGGAQLVDVRTTVRAATRTAMASLSPSVRSVDLYGEGGRNGHFVWDASDLSALVSVDPYQGVYVAPFSDPTGASGAWVREFDGAAVNDVWFGVVRGNVGATSGPDMRAEMQAALDFCRARGLDLRLSRGSVFVSQNGANAYCLLNEGVSMIGIPAKSTYSVIAPMPTVPSTADIIRFRPRTNQDQDFIQFTRFMVNPKQSGTAYGKRAFYMLTDNVCNVGQMLFSRMYCAAGNDYSLYFENSIATNAQGNPSNTIISECSLFEGAYLTGAGDNISIRDSFIITAVGSARHGIYVYQVDGGGGVASFVLIERNAMNANGSAILVDRARNLRIRDNNIEHSAGAGVNASVINLRGSGGQLSMPIVEGNAIGIFGTSTAQIGINVQVCYFAQVAENNIITDVVRTHAIIVGSSSANTRIARNKVSPEWTNNVTDSGTGTTATDSVESSL